MCTCSSRGGWGWGGQVKQHTLWLAAAQSSQVYQSSTRSSFHYQAQSLKLGHLCSCAVIARLPRCDKKRFTSISSECERLQKGSFLVLFASSNKICLLFWLLETQVCCSSEFSDFFPCHFELLRILSSAETKRLKRSSIKTVVVVFLFSSLCNSNFLSAVNLTQPCCERNYSQP